MGSIVFGPGKASDWRTADLSVPADHAVSRDGASADDGAVRWGSGTTHPAPAAHTILDLRLKTRKTNAETDV